MIARSPTPTQLLGAGEEEDQVEEGFDCRQGKTEGREQDLDCSTSGRNKNRVGRKHLAIWLGSSQKIAFNVLGLCRPRNVGAQHLTGIAYTDVFDRN